MNTKKLSFLVLVSTVSPFAFSSSAHANSAFTGFSVGAGAGVSVMTAKEKVDESIPGGPASLGMKNRPSSTRVQPDVNIAYADSPSTNLILGVKVGAFYDNQAVKSRIDSNIGGLAYGAAVKLERQLGFYVRPTMGYLVSPTVLAYAGAQIELSRFRLRYSSRAATGSTAYTEPSSSMAKTRLGVGPAVGVAFQLNKDWVMDASYTYIFYKGFNTADASGSNVLMVSPVKISPNTSTFKVGFSYKF